MATMAITVSLINVDAASVGGITVKTMPEDIIEMRVLAARQVIDTDIRLAVRGVVVLSDAAPPLLTNAHEIALISHIFPGIGKFGDLAIWNGCQHQI